MNIYRWVMYVLIVICLYYRDGYAAALLLILLKVELIENKLDQITAWPATVHKP